MLDPLISVLMPVRNSEIFVAQAIESILSQTFTDFELIIVDDGSTDNTLSVVKKYDDNRIRLFESDHRGVAYQTNFAAMHSRGKYLTKMDADDISHANRLAEHYSFLGENPNVELVGNNIRLIDSKNKNLGVKKFPESNSDINYFLPIRPTVFNGTMTVSRKTFEALGGYNVQLEVGEDHDFLIRVCSAGYNCYNIQKELYFYRIYERKENERKIVMQNKISYEIGKKYLELQSDKVGKVGYDYNYKMGLIEYYRGSISESKKYFFSAIRARRNHFFHLGRFIIISSLLARQIQALREMGIMRKMNSLFNRYLAIDMQNLKR
ncbi:MAG: glycosyltransferase [Bacteroidota bacterium]